VTADKVTWQRLRLSFYLLLDAIVFFAVGYWLGGFGQNDEVVHDTERWFTSS
jgi:hypothetical protein